jgi:hypothetical protein
MPSPSLYFPFLMALVERPWATSMLISLRMGLSIVIVPRSIFKELERISKTLG